MRSLSPRPPLNVKKDNNTEIVIERELSECCSCYFSLFEVVENCLISRITGSGREIERSGLIHLIYVLLGGLWELEIDGGCRGVGKNGEGMRSDVQDFTFSFSTNTGKIKSKNIEKLLQGEYKICYYLRYRVLPLRVILENTPPAKNVPLLTGCFLFQTLERKNWESGEYQQLGQFFLELLWYSISD